MLLALSVSVVFLPRVLDKHVSINISSKSPLAIREEQLSVRASCHC